MLSNLSGPSLCFVPTGSRQIGRSRQQCVIRAAARRSYYEASVRLEPSVGPEPGAKVQLVKRTTTVAAPPPPPPPPPKELLPTSAKVGLAVGAAMVALIVTKPWVRRGSVETLADRGVGLTQERGEKYGDDYYKGIMNNVRTVPVPELSAEQIEAARSRRRASTPKDDVKSTADFGEVDIPSNHPWATKKVVTPEEEEAKRLQVMKMNRPRGQPPPPSG